MIAFIAFVIAFGIAALSAFVVYCLREVICSLISEEI